MIMERLSASSSACLQLCGAIALGVSLVWGGSLNNRVFAQDHEIVAVGNRFIIDDIDPPAVARNGRAAWNPAGDFGVVWLDNFQGQPPFNSLATVMDVNATGLTAPTVLQSFPDTDEALSPDIAPTSAGFLTAYASEDPEVLLFDLYTTAIDRDGEVLRRFGTVNHPFVGRSVYDPRLAGFAKANPLYLATWSDSRFSEVAPPGANLEDIFARRLNESGFPLDATDYPVNDFVADTFARYPAAAANDQGDFLVVWSDNRVLVDDEPRFDIYSRLVPRSFSGNVSTQPNTQEYPITPHLDAILLDATKPEVAFGDGFFLVVWQDGPDVLARPVHANGVPSSVEEFVVNDLVDGQFARDPAVDHCGGGLFFIVWRDSRDGGSLRGALYDVHRNLFVLGDFPLLTEPVIPENADPDVVCTQGGRALAVYGGPSADAHVFGQLYDTVMLGDLNGDRTIDHLDFFLFSNVWNPLGAAPVDPWADIDLDGDVDARDLLRMQRYQRALPPATGKQPLSGIDRGRRLKAPTGSRISLQPPRASDGGKPVSRTSKVFSTNVDK